jgi:hypothetical protein
MTVETKFRHFSVQYYLFGGNEFSANHVCNACKQCEDETCVRLQRVTKSWPASRHRPGLKFAVSFEVGENEMSVLWWWATPRCRPQLYFECASRSKGRRRCHCCGLFLSSSLISLSVSSFPCETLQWDDALLLLSSKSKLHFFRWFEVVDIIIFQTIWTAVLETNFVCKKCCLMGISLHKRT